MEYMTIQKNIGSSPRKVRLVADMIRKMSPEQAIETLRFTNKSAALPLLKAIKTAMANAGGGQDFSFKKIEINEGMKLRRFRAGTAGPSRGRPYRRRFSQIKIVLTDESVGAVSVKSTGVNKKMQKAAATEAEEKGEVLQEGK